MLFLICPTLNTTFQFDANFQFSCEQWNNIPELKTRNKSFEMK